MKSPRIRQQSGYVLILLMLALMGLGGIAITGYMEQVRQETGAQRFQHNQRVLRQAKQALLMHAYNYPDISVNGIGPGRLPCPDVNNDGLIDGAGTCADVGRFPYLDTDLNAQNQILVDASGETLWYAVSDNFDNVAGGGVINSDTTGNITVFDQSGGVLYDGSVAGVAAVIIAPGPILKRDENNDGTYEYPQIRDTVARRLDPRNYLDTLYVQGAGANNELDNSVYTYSESDSNDDGFIPGPIYDVGESEIVVNDQIIIITAAEVIAMAEKKVLETFAEAIDAYQQQFWALPANERYPWLSAYSDTTDLNIYNAQPGETMGRVPFLDYHLDYDSPHKVVTDLQIGYDVTLTYTSIVDNADPFDPTYIDEFSTLFTGFPAGAQTATISGANVSFSKTTFDGVTDVTTDDVGTMISETGVTAVVNPPVITVRRYYWDGCPTCTVTTVDGWDLCPVNSGTGEDCARDPTGAFFVPFTDWNNHADIQVRLIKMELAIDPDFVIELDYDPAPVIGAPTVPGIGSNASFSATYNATEVTDYSVADLFETNVRNFIDLNVICDQDTFVGSGLDLYDLGNEDGGTILCAVNLAVNISATLNNSFVITADYYPQLPQWVADNFWDDAVMMTYAPDFQPLGDGSCAPEDGDVGVGAGDDCLVITNLGGVSNDIAGLLVLAGEHDMEDRNDLNGDGDYLDANEAPDGVFSNDLHDIFEPENYSGIGLEPVPDSDPDPPSDTELDLVFDKREDVVPGNVADTLFIVDRLSDF